MPRIANKVLHVRSTIGMYGAEQVILNIASIGYKCSFDTGVLVIEGVNIEASELRNNLSLIKSKYNFIVSQKRFDINVIKELKKIAKTVSIVHTHDYKSLILTSISLAFTKTKIVHHVHGSLGNTISEKVYAYLERIFMLNANRVITVSNDQKLIIQNRIGLKNKVIQIDNGTTIYNKNITSKKQSDKFLMVMAARFTPEKNHKKAIDTISILCAKNYPVELVLLGDGPELENIKEYAKKCGIDKSIKFIGYTRDVKKWLDESKLMLITSVTEGLPMSMLEAMSSGLPIVSTPVGEIPNILKKSKGGWTAESEEHIASIIERLINNPEVLAVAGNDAYDFSKFNLSTENQISKIEAIYNDVIEGGG